MTAEAGCNRLYFAFLLLLFLCSELCKITPLLVLMKCRMSSGCALEKTGYCSKIEKGP